MAALAVVLVTGATVAHAQTEERELVARAKTTLDTARHDPQFGDAANLFKKARAVMVVPQLIKAGFFLGGEGGNGVLLTPTADGSWGNPLFYTLGAASFGLQIGIEQAEVVMFVMSEKALRAWTQDKVTLGVKAGLTVLVVGSNAAASATMNANVDIIAWAKTKGAYAGITLEGSAISPRNEWNTAYYGRAVSPSQMLKLSAQ
jgi:lipid-binding SYLF domain-containing protein